MDFQEAQVPHIEPQTFQTEPTEMDDTVLFRPLDHDFLGVQFEIGSSTASVQFDHRNQQLLVEVPPLNSAEDPTARVMRVDISHLQRQGPPIQLTIGRTKGTLNIPTDRTVSDRHLQIIVKLDSQGRPALNVTDLHSTNGTWFSETKKKKCQSDKLHRKPQSVQIKIPR